MLLRAKYKVRSNWLNHQTMGSSSPTWRSIEGTKHLMAQSACIQVGNGILLELGWIHGFLIYLLSSLTQRKAIIHTVHWLYLNSLIQVIKGGTVISSETYLMNKISKLFREFSFPFTHNQTSGYGLPLLMGKYQWNQLIGLAGERTHLLVKMCLGEKFGKPRFMRN